MPTKFSHNPWAQCTQQLSLHAMHDMATRHQHAAWLSCTLAAACPHWHLAMPALAPGSLFA